MKNLTYEALLENPELMNEVLRNARRERAEAIAPLVLNAMRALLRQPTRPASKPVLRPAHC